MLDGSCRRSSPVVKSFIFHHWRKKIADKAAKEGLSQESSRLLSYLTNSYHKAVEISQEEWFNETKDAVAQWVKYLLKKDPQAFIFVQKAARFSKRKRTAESYFSILLFYFQEERDQLLAQGLWGKEINLAIEAALQAQKKLQANVAFQGVAEQFSVKIIYGITVP